MEIILKFLFDRSTVVNIVHNFIFNKQDDGSIN